MAFDILSDSQFKAGAQVVSCELDEGAALLDLSKNVYYGLNPVAAEIWVAIQRPVSVATLNQIIMGKFDTGGIDVTDDVIAVLQDMHAAGLIDRADDVSE